VVNSEHQDDLHGDFIAVLDDVELERFNGGYCYPSGETVPLHREIDIVFINAKMPKARQDKEEQSLTKGAHWWSGLSTAALESGVVIAESAESEIEDILVAFSDTPKAFPLDIEAEFFHSTLSQWMGQQHVRNQAPLWDYAFWKAELESEGRTDDREIFSAQVYRGPSQEPEIYRYALQYEGKKVSSSEWLSECPDLLKSDEIFDDRGDAPSDSLLLTLMND